MRRSTTGLLALGLSVALVAGTTVAGAAASGPSQPEPGQSHEAAHAAPWGGQPSTLGQPLDTRLIKGLRSKDHTEAVKKIRIKLVSAPSKTVWTSTGRTVTVPMLWRIHDPKRAAKRIRICTEVILDDDYWCKTHVLRNFRKPQGDFWMRKTKLGWDIYTAPYYRGVSPYSCSSWEYFRPKVRRYVRVVDPRDGSNLVSARFGWTVRCSG